MLSRSLLVPVLAACAAALAPAPARADGEAPAEAGAAARREIRRTPIVEAVEKAAPSVVSIGTTRVHAIRYFDWATLRDRVGQQEQKGLGSGVIVHPSGLVVTNAHVINQADQVVVRLTGLDPATEAEIPATVVATDLAHDLALVRMEKPGPYPAATFGRSDDLMPGETVIAIGSPVGLGRTVSTGIVSALGRSVTIEQSSFEGLIQTDAAVNRGNSGGALLNILGEWIGVNSAIASLSGGSDGISFAIPIATVETFLSRAVQTGRVTGVWAGLEFEDDGRGNVTVARVFAAGPATRVGVRRGMRVVDVDGLRVASGSQATLALLESARRGKVVLRVETPQGPKRIEVPLVAPPTDSLAWLRLGLRAVEVTPEVAEQTRFRVGAGIVVTEVRDGGPAARIGLQPGDLLLTMGAETVRAGEDVLLALQAVEPGAAVPVTVARWARNRMGGAHQRELTLVAE